LLISKFGKYKTLSSRGKTETFR